MKIPWRIGKFNSISSSKVKAAKVLEYLPWVYFGSRSFMSRALFLTSSPPTAVLYWIIIGAHEWCRHEGDGIARACRVHQPGIWAGIAPPITIVLPDDYIGEICCSKRTKHGEIRQSCKSKVLRDIVGFPTQNDDCLGLLVRTPDKASGRWFESRKGFHLFVWWARIRICT